MPPPMPPAGVFAFNPELSKMESPRSPDRKQKSDSRTVVRTSPPRSPDRTNSQPKNRYTDSAKRTSQSTGSKRRWSAESVINCLKSIKNLSEFNRS